MSNTFSWSPPDILREEWLEILEWYCEASEIFITRTKLDVDIARVTRG